MGFVEVLDLGAVLYGEFLRSRADVFAQGFGESRVIEATDVLAVEKCRHALGITGTGYRAGDDDAVIAAQHAM
jgi:hypothetical protein